MCGHRAANHWDGGNNPCKQCGCPVYRPLTWRDEVKASAEFEAIVETICAVAEEVSA